MAVGFVIYSKAEVFKAKAKAWESKGQGQGQEIWP